MCCGVKPSRNYLPPYNYKITNVQTHFWCVWVSLSTPAIVVHVGAAERSAKGQDKVEYKTECVVINK